MVNKARFMHQVHMNRSSESIAAKTIGAICRKHLQGTEDVAD